MQGVGEIVNIKFVGVVCCLVSWCDYIENVGNIGDMFVIIFLYQGQEGVGYLDWFLEIDVDQLFKIFFREFFESFVGCDICIIEQ